MNRDPGFHKPGNGIVWMRAGTDEFGARQAASFVLAFAFMAVPAFFMGLAFPLAGEIHSRGRSGIGAAVGQVLAANTIGAILGSAVSGFVLLYVIFIISGTVILAMLGSDLVTSGTSIVSMMGNMGPGLGEAGPASNFLVFGRPARGVLMFFMLAGRLEMFPILLGVFSLVTRARNPFRRARARVTFR